MDPKRYGRHLNSALKPGQTPHTVIASGRQLFYTVSGDGYPVVLLHGIPGGQRHLSKLVATLQEHFTAITPDLPGFGASEPAPASTLLGFAESVVGLLDALEIERCALVGHSLGGAVAMQVAALVPDRISHLALLAPVGLRPHQSLRSADIPFQELVNALEDPSADSKLRDFGAHFARIGFRRFDPREIVETVRFMASMEFPDLADLLVDLDIPTMAVRTEDDASVEREVYDELLARLPPGPRVEFPEGGHFVQNTLATEIGSALIEWIQVPATDPS